LITSKNLMGGLKIHDIMCPESKLSTKRFNARIIACFVIAALFLCSLSLRDIEPIYGLTHGGKIMGGGGGEGKLAGPLGGNPNIPSTHPSIPNAPHPGIPDSPVIGEPRDNLGPLAPVSPVGPHGPYGPGPAGPRAQPEQVPRLFDSGNTERNDNTIINNNNDRIDRTQSSIINENIQGPTINAPKTVIPPPPTAETPSQADITITPPPAATTETEEEQPEAEEEQEPPQQTNTEESTTAQVQNQIPIANAGASLTVQPTSTVALDGTKSYDPNGDPLSFLWLQLAGGPTVSLFNNTTATPSFVAPSVTNTTMLSFQLIVSDGITDSMPSYSYIRVQP
jgi:hypothetical protein